MTNWKAKYEPAKYEPAEREIIEGARGEALDA